LLNVSKTSTCAERGAGAPAARFGSPVEERRQCARRHGSSQKLFAIDGLTMTNSNALLRLPGDLDWES
jgi:hypothetical protein